MYAKPEIHFLPPPPTLSFLFKARSHCVVQVALNLAAIILPHPFENWDYRYETPHPPRPASL